MASPMLSRRCGKLKTIGRNLVTIGTSSPTLRRVTFKQEMNTDDTPNKAKLRPSTPFVRRSSTQATTMAISHTDKVRLFNSMDFVRWTRLDIFMHINLFTKNMQNKDYLVQEADTIGTISGEIGKIEDTKIVDNSHSCA